MDYYEMTANGAMNRSTKVADDSSTTSDFSDSDDSYYCVDIFGNKDIGGKELAYLMPTSKDHATTWFTVVPKMDGMFWNNSQTNEKSLRQEWKSVQKGINGFCNVKSKLKQPGSGIKHFRSNRIRLFNQVEYFDKTAAILIVPIMTAVEMTQWTGEGYSAIFLAGHVQSNTFLNEQDGAAEVYRQNLDITSNKCKWINNY
jgi:hypothetical protein